MNHKVAKFGGTSLANFEAMSRCADIVLSSPSTRIVVVSASSGVTNLLVSLSTGELSAVERIDAIKQISDIQSRNSIMSHRAAVRNLLMSCLHVASNCHQPYLPKYLLSAM